MFEILRRAFIFLIFLCGLTVNSFGFDFGRIGEPVPVETVSGNGVGYYTRGGSIAVTEDQLTMILNVYKDRGLPVNGDYDLYMFKRASKNSPWYDKIDDTAMSAKNMNDLPGSPSINTEGSDYAPSLSWNGTILVWEQGQSTWISEKKGGIWGNKESLSDYNKRLGGGSITTGHGECDPAMSEDGKQLIVNTHDYNRRNPGEPLNRDLYIATREDVNGPFGAFTPITNVNAPSIIDEDAAMSSDGLLLFFLAHRRDGSKYIDVWVSEREKTTDPWGTPINWSKGFLALYGEKYPEIDGDCWAVEVVGTRDDLTILVGRLDGPLFEFKFGLPVTIYSIADQKGVRMTVKAKGRLAGGDLSISSWQEWKGDPTKIVPDTFSHLF